MKYVIVKFAAEDGKDPVYAPVIFPDWMVHALVVEALTYYNLREQRALGNPGNVRFATPVTAGFIDFHDVTCHGKSETLKIGAHELDSQYIEFYQYLGGGLVEPPSLAEPDEPSDT